MTDEQTSVTVTISPDGTVTAEADGFQGVSCKAATQQLLKKLHGASTSTDKPEMTTDAEQAQQAAQGQ